MSGQLNYFKLFINKSLTLLSKHGHLSFVVQNSIIGDKQCSKLRELILKNYHLKRIHSFPERDSKRKRVFESAKMSVAIITIGSLKSENDRLTLSVWKERDKINGITTSTLCKDLIGFIDYTRIPLFDHESIQLYKKIKEISSVPLKNICPDGFHEGEAHATKHKNLFSDTKHNASYKKLYSGASIQKYFISENPSQGSVKYINTYEIRKQSTLAKYANQPRVVMQGIGSSDYRLVSCVLPSDSHIVNSTNFMICDHPDFSNIDVCCYLNTKLFNWMFRMFSTNSNINNYEISGLPLLPFSNNEKKLVNNIYSKLSKYTTESCKSDLFIQLESELDSLIYKKFNLSGKDISIIESKFK